MLDKRYFIVTDKTADGDAVSFANGSKNSVSFDIMKMDREGLLPTGATVIEYDTGEEARIAAMGVLFNDYSGVSDEEFAIQFEAFTTNDKNLGRLLRQSVNAWSAKNAGGWPDSYHSAVWPLYDGMEQRLSDGALVPAYINFLSIPSSVNDPVTTDDIDLTALNALILSSFNNIFTKFPR